jgi:hypothetical protein
MELTEVYLRQNGKKASCGDCLRPDIPAASRRNRLSVYSSTGWNVQSFCQHSVPVYTAVSIQKITSTVSIVLLTICLQW